MLRIKNATLIMQDHLIPSGAVLMDGNTIIQFRLQNDVSTPNGCRELDAEGAYVGPGFEDIHTHAGDMTWFYENPAKAVKCH